MLAHDRNDVNGNFVGFDRLSGHRGSKAMVGLVEGKFAIGGMQAY